jgi:peptidyl-prolyl cis-trans isomerase C
MMTKQSHLHLVLVAALFAPLPGYSQQPKPQQAPAGQPQAAAPAGQAQAAVEAKPAAAPIKPVKITVNGVEIPASRFDLLAKQAQQQGQGAAPDLQNNIKDNLIKSEVVAQEAVKAGFDKNPEVASQLDLIKQQLLVRAYIQNFIKNNPVKDETLKAEYDAKKGDKEYKVQHILVETEKEAKDLIAQIKKGGDFDKLAKEKSKDAGSKEQGGKLDWSQPASFVKPFSDAMQKLKKGEMTQAPVKSQFGFHVIKLEDSRPAQVPPFDEVKDRIRQNQTQEQINKMVEGLRSKAKVEEKN